jgi:hypothetical protein
MKKWFEIVGVILILFLMVFIPDIVTGDQEVLLLPKPPNEAKGDNDVSKAKKQEIARHIKGIQIPFIANNGQIDGQVKFYAHTFGGTVFVTEKGEIVYALQNNSSEVKVESLKSDGRRQRSEAGRQMSELNPKSAVQNPQSAIQGVAIKETLVGGRAHEITGNEKAVTRVSYFKGNDTSQWKSNISTYDVVSLGEVYNGIELKLKAYGNNVEKIFCVKPGASPEHIKIQLGGAKMVRVNEEGQLEVETELGTVEFTKPVAYQEIDGKSVEVDVEYRIQEPEAREQIQNAGSSGAGKHKTCNSKLMSTNAQSEFRNPQLEYGFKVASYDRTKDLIIDPLLASTYLGGSEWDESSSIALDTSGNIYVTGRTNSSNFPTTSGAYDTSYSYGDVFVSKLDSGLTSLLVSTFLGGSGNESGYSLTLDTHGNVYVTGRTNSSNFPTTSGAYDTSYNSGAYDVFISKLNSELTSLIASTYLGGSGPMADRSNSLTLDTSGNIYVTGQTGSTNFPTTSGAYDTSFNGGNDYGGDVFVSKLNGELTSLLASTYLGGSEGDYGSSLALDTSGNVYVTGWTRSTNFPTTSGVYDTSFSDSGYYSYDVFVSKLDSGLTSVLASTFLGGSGGDTGYSLALDTSGNVYVTGWTGSTDFPTTSGAYDTSFNGSDEDVFVSKLNSGLTNLFASTYLGGSGNDYVEFLSLDTSGNVYVAGSTGSSDFPTTSGAYDTSRGNKYGGAFVSKLNGGLTRLFASTYLGGSGGDTGYSLALDTSGNVYVMGKTDSTDFPTTSGAYDTAFNGGTYDVFVSKLDGNLSASITSIPTPTPSPTPSPTSTATTTPTPTKECPSDGDVNEDGKLTAKDALLAFECALGKAICTSCRQGHADVNVNGKVTAADALCIFKAVLNGSSPSETLSCE